MSRSAGQAQELRAEGHLVAQGLQLVCRNYQSRRGELDLIMRHGETLVFVEVRFRASRQFASAAESITPAKQQRLRLAAEHFLLHHPAWQNAPCRFDVVAMDGPTDLNWITNAF